MRSVNVGRMSFRWKDPKNPGSGVIPVKLDEFHDVYVCPFPEEAVQGVRVLWGPSVTLATKEAKEGPTKGSHLRWRFKDGHIVLPVAIHDDATVEILVERSDG